MAVSTRSASRRLLLGKLSSTPNTASSIKSSKERPARSTCGMPETAKAGSPSSSPLLSSAIATDTMPANANLRRSGMAGSAAGASTSPSLYNLPWAASSTIAGLPGARRTISPFDAITTSDTPHAIAYLRCSSRCKGSPWAGTSVFGRTHSYIFFNSPRRGWPETCTSA